MKSPQHMEWHDLLEALRTDQCAVCALVDRATRRYVASLLHELVNDLVVRQRLRQSHGFCSRHVAVLVEKPDVLGLAILAEDVVGGLVGRLGQQLDGISGRVGPSQCPVCTEAARAQTDAVSTLAYGLADEDLRASYAAGKGLCLPHLARVAALASPSDRAWLEEAETAMLNALRGQLREIIRKNDYRYRQEPWGAERDAWIRALWKLAGRHVIPQGR